MRRERLNGDPRQRDHPHRGLGLGWRKIGPAACWVLLAAEDAAATVATFDVRLAQAADARNLPVFAR